LITNSPIVVICFDKGEIHEYCLMDTDKGNRQHNRKPGSIVFVENCNFLKL